MQLIRSTSWSGTVGKWTRFSAAVSGVVVGGAYLLGWTKSRLGK